MITWTRRHLFAVAISLALLLPATVMLVPTVGAEEPATDAFARTWARTDAPVAEGHVSRTWIWGPEAITPGLTEPYAEASGGARTVQYFDKSRMEITTDRNVEPGSPWYVTNGLLPVEMMTGQVQLGHDTFEQHEPAAINIAGDPRDAPNAPDAPTYAEVAPLMEVDALEVGTPLTLTLGADGTQGSDESYADAGVTAAYYVPETDHTVASVFWDFMNSSGTVEVDGALTTDTLFQDPFFAFGFPVTEAYWTTVEVGGEPTEVLVQVFERRVATYTPSNPEGWRVETGNVGQHYLEWRYEILNLDEPADDDDATEEPEPTPEPSPTPSPTPDPDDREPCPLCELEYGLGDIGTPGAPLGPGEFSVYTIAYTEFPQSARGVGEVSLSRSPSATIYQQKTVSAVVLSPEGFETTTDEVFYVIDWNDGSATITGIVDPHYGQFFPHTFHARGDFEVKVWAVEPNLLLRTSIATVTITVE